MCVSRTVLSCSLKSEAFLSSGDDQNVTVQQRGFLKNTSADREGSSAELKNLQVIHNFNEIPEPGFQLITRGCIFGLPPYFDRWSL